MTTINIVVKCPLLEGETLPCFVIDRGERGIFWLVTKKSSRRGYYEAIYLGNDCYHPFQYHGEIMLSEFKRVEKTRVVLKFD
jgi:hypothetical protein